ncbi:hypothetical protein U9M48_040375, partial [Paspalum notatum var. saurae]
MSDSIPTHDALTSIFRALLHFICIDSMRITVQHLLVAVERYATERLMVVTVHVETVATTLVLTDRHQCDRLTGSCIEFMVPSSHEMGDDAARISGED